MCMCVQWFEIIKNYRCTERERTRGKKKRAYNACKINHDAQKMYACSSWDSSSAPYCVILSIFSSIPLTLILKPSAELVEWIQQLECF